MTTPSPNVLNPRVQRDIIRRQLAIASEAAHLASRSHESRDCITSAYYISEALKGLAREDQ